LPTLPPRFARFLRTIAARLPRRAQSVTFGPRLLLTLIPAVIIVSVALSAVWGNNGLVTRAKLRGELDHAAARLATVDRENQRLLRELQLMEQDPQVLERVVAEELSWGRQGATIYRFDDEKTGGK
jgi:cell division protein FtsB